MRWGSGGTKEQPSRTSTPTQNKELNESKGAKRRTFLDHLNESKPSEMSVFQDQTIGPTAPRLIKLSSTGPVDKMPCFQNHAEAKHTQGVAFKMIQLSLKLYTQHVSKTRSVNASSGRKTKRVWMNDQSSPGMLSCWAHCRGIYFISVGNPTCKAITKFEIKNQRLRK